MNIKTQLKIVILVLIVLSVLIAIYFRSLFHSYQNEINKSKSASNIVLQVSQRRIFADEYLSTKTERAQEQWFAKNRDLVAKIDQSRVDFETPAEKELFNSMETGIRESQNVFSELVPISDKQNQATASPLLREKSIQLENQLAVKGQETISAASKLAEINSVNVDNNLRQIIFLFIFTAGLFLLMLFGSFAVLWRSITQLDSQKAKDEAILESIGEGMVALDLNGRVTLVNSVVEKLTGWTQKELLGKKWHDVVPVTDDKGVTTKSGKTLREQALADKKSMSSSKFRYVRKDKQTFPVARTVSPIRMGRTNLGTIEVFRDITHETEVDRMKTEFISIASHQLRTPLSAMKWYLEMLLAGDAGKLTAKQREIVDNVDQSNVRMNDLVNSLLNVSRMESGRIRVEPVPTDLGKLIKDVQTDLKAKIEEKKHHVTISIPTNLKKINLDQNLIRQVYMNLLSNAIKYTPDKGKVSVHVSVKGSDILTQITDNGYGIPEKDQGKLFQKFFRAANVSKMVVDGNGLGMYLVKSIIEAAGGKIWFESAEDKGTTFWFTLPIAGMVPKKGEVTME